MTPEMMCITDLDGQEARRAIAIPRPRCRCTSRCTGSGRTSQAVVHAHPPIATGVRGRRHSARSRGARRGRDDARQRADCGVRDAVDEGAAGGGPQVRQGARRHAARESRRADARGRSVLARTTRWRRSSTSRTSASSRGCSAASGCCRGRRSMRLQGLRGMYGIASPAPICADPVGALGDPAPDCQTVLAPPSPRARGSSPTADVRRVRVGADERNSANIPRTDRTDRRCGARSEVGSAVRP